MKFLRFLSQLGTEKEASYSYTLLESKSRMSLFRPFSAQVRSPRALRFQPSNSRASGGCIGGESWYSHDTSGRSSIRSATTRGGGSDAVSIPLCRDHNRDLRCLRPREGSSDRTGGFRSYH